MAYNVVMRDHDGFWHSVGGAREWNTALLVHRTCVYTLMTIDYYEQYPPSVVKIIRFDETDYEKAAALAEAV